MRARGLALLLAALLFFAAVSASAHGVGVSRSDYRVDGCIVHASLSFRRDELASVMGENPQATIATQLDVLADGVPCERGAPIEQADDRDGARISLDFTCAKVPSALRIDARFIERFASGHTHLVAVTRGSQKSEGLALLAKTAVDFELANQRQAFTAIVRVGVEHILSGYDHLTFLLALLLVPATKPRRLWPIAGVLTAFTLGHTASLAVASLGWFVPSGWLIEPAIALSIAYVGAENFFIKSWRHRWILTLPFGLVHGFGFASGLLDLAVDRADLPRALFAFNAGVELGQLAVLALALPLLLLCHRSAHYERGRRVLSATVVALGLVWFFLRVRGNGA